MNNDSVNFATASRVEASGEGRFSMFVPEGWNQGRGAFGGLLVGAMIRSMQGVADADRPLRAVNAELPSAVLGGPAELRVQTLRRGSGLSSLEVHLVQGDGVKARASGIFGKERPVELSWQPAAPTPKPWRDVPATPPGALPPPFVRHFELRPTRGVPFTGSDEPVVEGWVRPVEEMASWGPAEVAALADSYWPAFFPCVEGPRPAATVAFGLHLTPIAHELPTTAPLYYRARALTVGGGFVFEQRELWTEAGQLVALNPQTFTIIK